MDAERGLRDELESLQTESRALKAELSRPHSPGFPEAKASREADLRAASERAGHALATRDRLRGEKSALEARVVRLTERLRIAQQERLGLVMLAVLPSMGLVSWSMQYVRHEAHLAATACAAVLGLALGPRVLRWGRGDTRAGQPDLGTTAAQLTVHNVGLLPFGLALLATLGPMAFANAAVFRGRGGTFLAVHLVLLIASLAVVAARRGERLADEGQGAYRRLATSSGALALLPLALLFMAGALGVRDADGFDATGRWFERPLRELLRQGEGLAMMAPLTLLLPWRLDGALRRDALRPWAWGFAGLAALVALLATAAAVNGLRTSSPFDSTWAPRDRWVPAHWHAGALAAWCAAGAGLWLARALDAREARQKKKA